MKKAAFILRKTISITLAFLMLLSFSACGKREEVTVSIWTPEAKYDMMNEFMQEFAELHEDEIDLHYSISREEEDTCKETVLADINGAADIFPFPDDQLDELKEAGALLELDVDPAKALEPFGGIGSVAYQSVVRDDKMYAYPETANGYFLFYNKKYLSEENVKSLEKMVQIAGNINKKVSMDLCSGWYLYSFFKGAGLTLKLDETGKKNICNWDSSDTSITGRDVAQAIANLAVQRGFKSMDDDEFIKSVQNGRVIAGVNGAWNAEKVLHAWGAGYAATKLPTYRAGHTDLQMGSYAGYKVLGVNAKTKYPEWCRKIIEFIVSKDNQIREFEKTGEVPANLDVADDEKVKDAPAVKALSEQSKYADLQRVAPSYWDAAGKFGITLASGNPDKKNINVLLYTMVKDITQ